MESFHILKSNGDCCEHQLCTDCGGFTVAATGGDFLSSGNLESACNIGDYKIEWRHNSLTGPVVLTSGIGSDPTIQVNHPFSNEIVSSGTIYSVIVYVYVDGQKYSSDETDEEALYSEDLNACLEEYAVIISAIDCTTSLNPSEVYDVTLSYNNAIHVGQDKSREFRYELGPTTNYWAWGFTGFSVAEGFEVFYCTIGDPVGTKVENWLIGSVGIGATNYLVDPQRHGSTNQVRTVINLTGFTYQAGDYLRIKITGAIVDPTNENTNWTLRCKCLETFDCQVCTEEAYQVDPLSATMTWDSVNCRYVLSYNRLSTCASSDIRKYIGTGTGDSAIPQFLNNTPGSPITLTNQITNINEDIWLQYGNIYSFSVQSISLTFIGIPTLTVTKTGSTVLLEFSDNSSYTTVRDNLVARHATISSGFVNDNTDINYYRFFDLAFLETVTSCGDNQTARSYKFHRNAVPVYDDVNFTITVDAVLITNGLTNNDCDNAASGAASTITISNNTYNAADFSFSTVCLRSPSTVQTQTYTVTPTEVPTRIVRNAALVRIGLINDVCDLTEQGWCIQSSDYRGYYVFDRITLTDPSTHTSRLENWTWERQIGLPDSGCGADNFELIFEMAGGVQVFP